MAKTFNSERYHEVVKYLDEFVEYYQLIQDPRQYAYMSAINSMDQYLSDNDSDPIDAIIKDEKIYRIGPAIRSKILAKLSDDYSYVVPIRREIAKIKNQSVKNPHKHYIHRDDVFDMINNFMSMWMSAMNAFIDEYELGWELVGSYRRKSDYCGDGDILIKSNTDISIDFINFLESLNEFSFSAKGSNKLKIVDNDTKFEIDVRFCNPDEFGTFILHMTGSAKFNIKMRQLAKSKGMSLSEYGIVDENNILHKFTDEESIFEFLNLEYIKPEDR